MIIKVPAGDSLLRSYTRDGGRTQRLTRRPGVGLARVPRDLKVPEKAENISWRWRRHIERSSGKRCSGIDGAVVYLEAMGGGRDNFTKDTRHTLALRVGTLCSNPSCNVPTCGPHSDELLPNNLGKAAHICAAAEGGPRYDASQTSAERRSIQNGIWLCASCADKIDRDPVRYPVGLLRTWKAQAESAAQVRLDALVSDAHGLQKLHEATNELLAWPQNLADGTWLERPEASRLAPDAGVEGGKPIVLLGAPGSGKSALLARAGMTLKERGWTVIAIKADHLPNTINTTEDLRQHLGLVAPLQEVVYSLNTRAPTALLIDQLDAVSDLTDQHSGRLDVLLRVIRHVARIPGVLTICSARKFDFDHDLRFSHLDAQQIDLAPVSVEELAPVLEGMGFDVREMPPKLIALLRIPQWLRAFQRLHQDARPLPTSWQALLERVWEQLVLSPLEWQDANRSLVNELARRISEREELWVYRASLESHAEALKRLLGAGLLALDGSGKRVGFAHQTFYEFARVRAFLANEDLLDFVQSKESSLFVRPVVWTALEYLRDPSSDHYHDMLRRIWDAPLRSHLRLLLVDFLGRQEEPDDVEAELLLSLWQDPTWKDAILGAVHRSSGWFDRLMQGPLLDLMRSPEAGLAYPILCSALHRAPEKALALMRQEWFGSESRSGLVLQLLARLESWSEEAYDQAQAALLVQPDPHEGLSLLLWGLKKKAPEFGVRLLGAALRRDLRETMKDLPRGVPPPKDAPMAAHMQWYSEGQPKKAIAELIRRAQRSSSLIDLSEAAPVEFLEEILPWLSAALEPILSDNEGWVCYREDGLLETRPGEGGVVHELGDSMKSASRRAAKCAPTEFLRIVGKYEHADVGPLHLCLSFGFPELSDDYIGAVVDYLTNDLRRFCLGNGLRQFWPSVDLVKTIGPRLNREQVGRLESAILTLKPIPESDDRTPQSRWHARRSNRRVRFHLLAALPPEHLADMTRATLEQERRVLSEDERPGIVRVSGTGPTMSSEQMRKSQDQHIVGLFDELVDETGFHHPRRWLQGGSVQAAREFGELTKSDWSRAMRIVAQLNPARCARPIAEAIRQLSETEAPTHQIIQLVEECVARGATATEFRDAAAETFRERALREKGLSPVAVTMLQLWLEEAPARREPSDAAEQVDMEPPFLWGYGVGFRAIPDGSYRYLKALTVAYLVNDEPKGDKWLEVLSSHLRKDPKDPAWAALLRDFDNLKVCETSHAEAFLDDLLAANPRLVADPEWLQVFCYLSWWMSESCVERHLDLMKDSCPERAYGELLCLIAVRERAIGKVRRALSLAIGGSSSRSFLLGVATSAAHMWAVPSARHEASKVLLRLLEERDDELDGVIVEHAFRETLMFDADGIRVLEVLTRRPRPFLNEKVGRGLSELSGLISVRPEMVARLCQHMIEELEASRHQTESVRFRRSARDLVEFTLTLQRVHGCREQGLELFERLLRLGIHGARELLSEVDRRVADVT